MTELRVTVASDRGLVREANQDRIVVGRWILGPESEGPATIRADQSDWLVSVIDGMGGHAGGGIAATIAAETIASYGEHAAGAELLTGIVEAANRAIYDRMNQHPSLTGMGAAVACATFHGDDLLVVNVGDVRAYLINDSYLIQLSVDDTSPDGALTASLGGRAHFEPVAPHVVRESGGNELRVLLASDGLTAAVGLDALEELVVDDDTQLVTGMLDAVLAAGAPDNVSLALLRRTRRANDDG